MSFTHLYEGDLVVMKNINEKLAAQVVKHESSLSAIVTEVRDIQTQVRVRSPTLILVIKWDNAWSELSEHVHDNVM